MSKSILPFSQSAKLQSEDSHPGRKEASAMTRQMGPATTQVLAELQNSVICGLIECDKVQPHPSMQPFLKNAETSSYSASQRDGSLDASEVVLVTCDTWSDRTELIVDNLCLEGMSCVILASDEQLSKPAHAPSLLLACLVNDEQAGEEFLTVVQSLREARNSTIVLVPNADKNLEGTLRGHGYSVISADSVSQANERLVSLAGSGLILLGSSEPPEMEKWEFPAVPMLVFTETPDTRLNCLWMQRGAVGVFTAGSSEQEVIMSVARLMEQQERWKALSRVAYRNTSTGIRNENYLFDVGTRLYSSAQRGQLAFAMAIIKLEDFGGFLKTFESRDRGVVRNEVYALLESGLRASDILVQRTEDEFVCLVSGVGNSMISEIFERLRSNMCDVLDQRYASAPVVSVGGTAELGVTFEGMLHRASMALHQTRLRFDNKIIVL